MRKLYYVVEKELQGVGDGIEETTGNKLVYVYMVIDNDLVKFFELDIQNKDNTESAIREYLDDNGYEDETFTLITI